MKIFVVDFSNTNKLTEKIPKNMQVMVEKSDGAVAYKKIGEQMPDVILVNYKDKPGHCRQTVQSIRQRKKTANIPIYFVDGAAEEIEKVKLIGQSITIDELEDCLTV